MKFKFASVFLVILFLNFQNSFAQWQILPGPFGVETTATAIIDSLCFAGTSRGLIVSSDSAQNWMLDNVSLNGTSSRLTFKEGIMIYDRAFNTSGGVLSLDSGNTWNQMTSAGAFTPIKYAISNGIFYVWCSYGFLFYSTDMGATWIAMYAPPSTNNTNDFTVDNGRIYVSKSSIGTGVGHIYFSDDFGATWFILSSTGITGTSFEAYQILPNANQLFTVCNSDIYKSIDGGNNWSVFNTGLPNGFCCYTHFSRISVSNDKIYTSLSNNGGLFQSDTASANFINISQGLPEEVIVYNVTEKNNLLYASTNCGLYSTDKTIINWQQSQNGIHIAGCNALCVSDSTLLVGSQNSFFVSHSNGNTFSALPSAVTTSGFSILNNTLLAAGGKGYKSVDGGNTWSNINFPYGFSGQQLIDLCMINNNYFGLNIDQTIKYSNNNGSSWSSISGIPTNTANCLAALNSLLLVGTTNGIYKSSNNGATWTNSLIGSSITDIAIDNGNIYVLASNAVWVSMNNGISWTNTNFTGPYCSAFCVKNNILVVSPGLLTTNDFGATWNTLIPPGPSGQANPNALAMNSDYLFAGYVDSIYRLPISTITAVNEFSETEIAFSINPNPATDLITLKLNKETTFLGIAKVKISDLSGRSIYENSFGNEQNSMNISVKKFQCGIYFIEISTNNQRSIKKIILE